MAVQSFPYLALTDGTDTVTFMDGAGGTPNWPLAENGWAPAIAGLRTSPLGGRGPYADVEEQLTCNILGTTAALCYANLDTLARLLDKAERWWLRGETISPVLLKYAPQGSTIASTAAPLVAIVLGRAGGDEKSGIGLPQDISEAGMLYEIYGVKVSLLRRGPWIGASETASATAVANPAILTITMPSTALIPSPIEIDFTGFATQASNGYINMPTGFVLIGPNNAFALLQGESPTATGGKAGLATYTSTADSTARASGGSVGRLDHAAVAIGTQSYIGWALPAAFLNSTRIGIYLTYRNNSATSWTIRAEAVRVADMHAAIIDRPSTPITQIPAAIGNPTAIYLGAVAGRHGFDKVDLAFVRTGGSGTATLDIDTIVAVDLSTGAAYTLAFQGMDGFLGTALAAKTVVFAINFNPAVTRDPEASVALLTTGFQAALTATGDLAFCANGLIVQAIWYATNSTFWTTQNDAFGATLSIGATVIRRLAFLSPQ